MNLKNLVKMSGGRCPENPYQGFYQKTGQCWLDAVSMALIFGGDTSDTIITQITQITEPSLVPIFLDNVYRQNKTLPFNITTLDNRDLFRECLKIYMENISKRLIQTLQNTEESYFEDDSASNEKLHLEMHEKLGLPAQVSHEKLHSALALDLLKNLETESKHVGRRGSYDFSVKCMISTFEMTNINRRKKLNLINSGGDEDHQLWVVYLYNYLFLSDKLIVPLSYIVNEHAEKEQFINYDDIDIDNIISILITFSINGINFHCISLFKCISGGNIQYWLYDNETDLVQFNWNESIKRNHNVLYFSEILDLLNYPENTYKIQSAINLGYCDKYDYMQLIPDLGIKYKRYRDRCDNLIPIKNKMNIYTKIKLGLYTDEEIAPYFSDIHPAYLLDDTESGDDIHPASIVQGKENLFLQELLAKPKVVPSSLKYLVKMSGNNP